MAGTWRIPVGECDLGVSNPPLICARCDGEVERGFQWDFDEIVVCEEPLNIAASCQVHEIRNVRCGAGGNDGDSVQIKRL